MISTPEIITTTEQRTAAVHLVIPCQDMGRYMDPAIQEVLMVLRKQGLYPSGPMICLHNRRPTDSFDFEIGFPVARAIVGTGRVRNSAIPAVKVVRAMYQGPYEDLGKAWGALQAWVAKEKLPVTERFWECYLNNPNEVKDPKAYRTELNWVLS